MLLFKSAPILLVMTTSVLVKTSGYAIDLNRGYDEGVLGEIQAIGDVSTGTVNTIHDAVKRSDKKSHSMTSVLNNKSETPSQAFNSPTTTTNTIHPLSTDHPQSNGNNTGPMVDYMPCLLPFEFCTASSYCCPGSCQIYPYPVANITVCIS